MDVYIGNDHAGVEMAKALADFLQEQFGYMVHHLGAYDEASVDYPDFGAEVGRKVSESAGAMGVVICGTGIGISIAANKIHGIRCANCVSPYMAEMARKHNDANVLALGARLLNIDNAKIITQTFFDTLFEEDRHARRVKKLNAL